MAAVKYKVLAADDEHWTREKIKHMICWEDYSLEFLKPAVDGEDVLKKIEAEEPDILITDINMPFLNGVELLQILQERYPEIITFVISGYDDFEYVKSTFMAGSINYLLKPINKLDLVNALSKALEVISSRRCAKENAEKQKLSILKAASLIQDREFSLLLEKVGGPVKTNITMSNTMNFTGVSLVLIKIHNMKELMTYYHYDMNLLSYSIKKVMKNIFNSEDMVVFNYIYRPNEFIVISPVDHADLKKKADKFMICFSPSVKSPITVIISEHTYSMENINAAYVQAVSLLMTRKFRRENALLIFRPPTLEKGEGGIKIRVKDVQIMELKSLLKQNNKGAVKTLIFDTIGLGRCEDQGWEYLDVKQTVRKVLNAVFEYSTSIISPEELVSLENMIDMTDKTIERLDIKSLHEALEMILDATIVIREKEGGDFIKAAIKQAVAYIDENYFEELSLATMAEQYHVESTYFSRLFRQVTGVNFVMYISVKRIEKAMEYIKRSDINLTEIAFMVGYVDYTYFSRVFRKITGKNPRDFRREIMGQGGSRQMRKAACSILLTGMIVLLSGCSKGEGTLITKEDESIVLTVLAGQSTVDAGVEDMITKSVIQEFPNVKLEWECVDWGEQFDAQMRARFSAGDVPDIIIGKAQDVKVYAGNGNLAPLTNLHTQDIADEALQTVLMDGIPYGLPYNAWYQGVIYNKEIFLKYNLQVPTTINQLEAVVTLLQANGVTPFASHFKESWVLGNRTMQFFMNEIFNTSPRWGDEFRNEEASFTETEKIRYCIENNKKILDHSWEDALLIDQFEADNRFTKQEAVMYLTGSWSLQFANQYSGSLSTGIFPFPNEEGDAKLIRETNMTFMKSADTENGELIDEIFNHMLGDAQLIQEILDYTQTVSVINGVDSSFRSCIQDDIDSYEGEGKVIDAALGNAQLIWSFQNKVGAQQLLWLRGQKNIEEVLAYADEHRDESGY